MLKTSFGEMASKARLELFTSSVLTLVFIETLAIEFDGMGTEVAEDSVISSMSVVRDGRKSTSLKTLGSIGVRDCCGFRVCWTKKRRNVSQRCHFSWIHAEKFADFIVQKFAQGLHERDIKWLELVGAMWRQTKQNDSFFPSLVDDIDIFGVT